MDQTESKPQVGVSAVKQPPEGDGWPGRDGEQANVERPTATGEAETPADLPDDAEQLQAKENDGNSTATVKMALEPQGHVMTKAFAIGLSIRDLKHQLASELRVPPEVLQICLDGRVAEEQQSLMELGIQPHSSTRMEMSSTDPIAHPLRPLHRAVHDNMPDVITVRVRTDDGEFREAVVEIERPRQRKAFLGGYRNKLTGVEHHHASVQTLPKKRPDRGVGAFSRTTQTVKVKSQAQQSPADVSTQTKVIGCHVSCRNDRLLSITSNYITADEYHGRRLRAVIQLQSFVRRWLACKEVNQLKRQRDQFIAWQEAQKRRRVEEREEMMGDRHQRWMDPKTNEDFDLRYHTLETWRREEEERINSTLRGAERKAALCLLMEEEMQIIAALERQQIGIQRNNHDKVVKNVLDKLAAPIRWQRAADGQPIEMETQNTMRARELRDLYTNVNLLTVTREQRRSILVALKHTVMEYSCPLTREIVDLIDREVDLMPRVKTKTLGGLRKRISTLLLQFIKTPAFNPEVAKLLKVPQDPSKLKNKMFLCRYCNRYLHLSNFKTLAGSQCNNCEKLKNMAHTRNDFYWYKNILKRLRAEELRLNAEAKVPFLLKAEDMKYLVEAVWASRSALNGSSDPDDLVFARWDSQRDWSPWNCILLSKEESLAHMTIDDVHQVYDAAFIDIIEKKHIWAHRHFSESSVFVKYLSSQPAAALGN
ncbi:IQ motif and ubiquitin-like domain-containing protein [Brachionichthys hirsutus]|uniref:IQ motif and ubiquitin-like domain-containing protein n=1 Tax=Brachionichthys hirsutus TaxID=412623 RepID=UPI003604D37B